MALFQNPKSLNYDSFTEAHEKLYIASLSDLRFQAPYLLRYVVQVAKQSAYQFRSLLFSKPHSKQAALQVMW